MLLYFRVEKKSKIINETKRNQINFVFIWRSFQISVYCCILKKKSKIIGETKPKHFLFSFVGHFKYLLLLYYKIEKKRKIINETKPNLFCFHLKVILNLCCCCILKKKRKVRYSTKQDQIYFVCIWRSFSKTQPHLRRKGSANCRAGNPNFGKTKSESEKYRFSKTERLPIVSRQWSES